MYSSIKWQSSTAVIFAPTLIPLKGFERELVQTVYLPVYYGHFLT